MKAIIACGVCASLWIIAIIVIIGLIIDSIQNSATIATKFNETTNIFAKRIDETLNNSVSVLAIVASLASVVPRMTNRTMIEFLDGYLNHSHQTTSTIIWAEAVRNVTQQKTLLRAEGFINYTITPDVSGNQVRLPLTYVYPNSVNITLRGFDLLTDPMRQSSLLRANVSQKLTATPLILGITNNTLPRISIYDPVFDWSANSLKGVMYQNFFIETFIVNSLQQTDNSSLQLTWIDLNKDATNDGIMYQLNPNSKDVGHYHYEKTIEFAGRTWLFKLKNINVFTTSQKITTGSVIGALSLIIVIIIVVTVAFIRSRQKIVQQKKSTQLLSMALPEHVVAQLSEHVVTVRGGKATLKGNTLIAQLHRRVGICFIDICNFTILSSALTPASLVRMLDEFFTIVDELLDRQPCLTKIKTIGDAYFAVSGLGTVAHPGTSGINDADEMEKSIDSRRSSLDTTNLLSLVDFCISVQEKLQNHKFRVVQNEDFQHRRNTSLSESSTEEARCMAVLDNFFAKSDSLIKLQVRIGIHVGDIVAGVVGKKKPQYDVWGSACNIAARMESTAQFGQIQISQQVADSLNASGFGDIFTFKKRRVSLKGIGRVDAFSIQLDNEQVEALMTEEKESDKLKKEEGEEIATVKM